MADEKKIPSGVGEKPADGGNPDYAALLAEIASCKAEIQTLKTANALENVIINGVTRLSEAAKSLAEPLRAMGPRVREMPDATKEKLREIHLRLKRPDYGAWKSPPSKTPDRRTLAQAGEYSK